MDTVKTKSKGKRSVPSPHTRTKRRGFGRGPLECPYCPMRCLWLSMLRRHLLTHTGVKPHRCTVCKKRFSQKGNLNLHTSRYHGHDPHKKIELRRRDPKEIRGRTKRGHTQVQVKQEKPAGIKGRGGRSIQSHTFKIGRPCEREPTNSVKFVTKNKNGTKSHQCSLCPRVLSSKNKMETHLRIHTGERPFVCRICGTGFRQSNHLKVHYRTHTGEKPFKCTSCNSGFTIKISLDRHILRHHIGEKNTIPKKRNQAVVVVATNKKQKLMKMSKNSEGVPPAPPKFSSRSPHNIQKKPIRKSWVCIKCKTGFTRSSLHSRTHVGKKPWKCNHCQKSFPTQLLLKSHHQLLHHGNRHYMCRECKKRFGCSSTLQRHLLVHTGEKPFKCTRTACGKRFNQKASLTAHHVKMHSGDADGEKPFNCTHCYKSFLRKSNLQDHELTHTHRQSGKNGGYTCSICKLKFHGSGNFGRHIRKCKKSLSRENKCGVFVKVNDVKQEPCCSKSLVKVQVNMDKGRGRKSTIIPIPTRAQKNRIRKSFVCNFCKTGLCSPTTLKLHSKTHARMEKPWTCNHCQVLHANQVELSSHLESRHKEMNQFVCVECGRRFRLAQTLRRHLPTHTGEKPFKCGLRHCKKRFSDVSLLTIHTRSHTGHKPYVCNFCPRRFAVSSNLSTHSKTHCQQNQSDLKVSRKVPRKVTIVNEGELNRKKIKNEVATQEPGCSKSFKNMRVRVSVQKLCSGKQNPKMTQSMEVKVIEKDAADKPEVKPSIPKSTEKLDQSPPGQGQGDRETQWKSFLNLFNAKIANH